MRQPLTFVVVLLAAARLVAADSKSKPLDFKSVADKLEVFRDENGNYITSPKARAIADIDEAGKFVTYGNGKLQYQQQIVGSSLIDAAYEWVVWSPRAKAPSGAHVHLTVGTMHVSCAPKHKTALVPLSPEELRAFWKTVTFYPPLWKRQSEFLARDDDGVYYFVDRLGDDLGGKGFRVFVGQKGALKERPMTNVVSDSAGKIYSTKSGDLKIIAGEDGKAFWKKGAKKTELTVLELAANRYLIYRELGVYGQLGVVCDDQ